MYVDITTIDQATGDEKWVGRSTLEECFPDEEHLAEAKGVLESEGTYWCGGGASPLVRLDAVRK